MYTPQYKKENNYKLKFEKLKKETEVYTTTYILVYTTSSLHTPFLDNIGLLDLVKIKLRHI